MENNPCVIICTHQRLSITTTNIKLLIAQGVKVVLVVSDTSEKAYYDQFPVHVIIHPNNPLGAKWQAGVTYARQFDPSHIVITGSDDLLSKDFFEKYCFGDHIFTGFKAWYIWHSRKLHLLNYSASQALGGGRIYTRTGLNYHYYKLFDCNKNKLLDDYAWDRSWGWIVHMEPEILAVKGAWPVMNPVDLKHKNVKLIATYQGNEALKIMIEKFNYDGNQ